MFFVWILLAFVVISIFRGVKSVPQGFEYTVQRFGRYTHTLSPGLGFVAVRTCSKRTAFSKQGCYGFFFQKDFLAAKYRFNNSIYPG